MGRALLFWLFLLVALLLAGGLGILMLPGGPPGLAFRSAAYADMTGWATDDLAGFERAFAKSCAALDRMPETRPLPGGRRFGTVSQWKPVCAALDGLAGPALKAAVEVHLQPVAVTASGSPHGQFTGYYEPLLEGSRAPGPGYAVPLYARPGDLVEVDLGQFRADLAGRRVAGRVEGGRLRPYEDRRAIDAGALEGKVEPLVWVRDPVAAFFLHIQGSGRVQLPDGSLMAVGYAGQNGHPYVAVGRVLIREGHARPEDMSLQFIRRWLADNPQEQERVMHANPSFIFFRDLGTVDGPYGSAGVTLTPRRSLAVDRRHLPMHAPVFLETTHPDPVAPNAASIPFNRLMVAQDTGGAITGEIRGDVFFGPGEAAEQIAGHMNAEGRYYLLLPHEVAETLLAR